MKKRNLLTSEYKGLFKLSSELYELFTQLNKLLMEDIKEVEKRLLVRNIINKIQYNSLLYRREVYRILHLKENNNN